MTFEHACEYIKTMNDGKVHTSTMLLGEIKGALWAWLGIKETNTDAELAAMSSTGMGVGTVKTGAFEAWKKAGMPSPPERFFAKWNSENLQSG